MLPSTEKVDTKKSRNQLQETGKKALQPTLKLPEASAVSEQWKEIIKPSIDAFKAMFSATGLEPRTV